MNLVQEIEHLAWVVLWTVNRTQAKGSTARIIVPRDPEMAYGLEAVPTEDELLSAEEYLLDQGYVAPVVVGLTRGTYTITPAGLDWLDSGPPEPPPNQREKTCK